MNSIRLYSLLLLFLMSGLVNAESYDAEVKPLLVRYCCDCHSGDDPAGGVDFVSVNTTADARSDYEIWEKVDQLLANRKMPPEGEPQPTPEEVATIRTWYRAELIESVEAKPGIFYPRRLSATEYRNTLRSLFGFDLEVNIMEAEQTVAEKSLVLKLLPTDPPGESGFRNDTRRNPLSTQIWEQYSYLADNAINTLFSQKHAAHLETMTGKRKKQFSLAHAARLIRHFVPLAYRRDVPESELEAIVGRMETPDELQSAVKRELKRTLMSPAFLYRGLRMPKTPGRQQVDGFEFAERLSYFLWADMPDQELLSHARDGSLLVSGVLEQQLRRMIGSPKSRSLSRDFATQWLLLDEIDEVSNNPPVAEALKSQPVDFFQYLIEADRPLLEFVDSNVTFVSPLTRKYYPQDAHQLKKYRRPKGIEIEIVPNQKIALEKTEGRGGLLTMPGVLAMNRGPILRGVWMLERILGEHLPDPPADVGQVKANIPGQDLSFRERFAEHRANESCALCHDKIDPLGFALDHYDENGGYRLDASNPKRSKKKQRVSVGTLDASGQLPSGEKFHDFDGLKRILLSTQRKRITRNIVKRMMSYALCRKLTIYDEPVVADIVDDLLERDGTWRQLVYGIVTSVPFRETIVPQKPSNTQP